MELERGERERGWEEEPTGMYGKHEKHLQMQHKSVTPHVSIHVRGKGCDSIKRGSSPNGFPSPPPHEGNIYVKAQPQLDRRRDLDQQLDYQPRLLTT